MVNQDRIWHRLMQVAEIGKLETGGVSRTSFSEEDRQVKELVAGFMKEAGLRVYEDTAGNLIGRKEGTEPGASVVMTGSHLDTVYNGGNFDGVLGVIGGIEALQTMKEQGISLTHPIEVVAFTDEDSQRFNFGLVGSRAMTGTLYPDDLLHRDRDGITIAEAMRQAGYDPELIRRSARPKHSIKAFVELHIEQGKVLETAAAPVGIVQGIYSQLFDKFIMEGEAGHAGTTPMGLRKDPLLAAAETLLAIEAAARSEDTVVATTGRIETYPGGINIIPGRVEFSLDIRGLGDLQRDAFESRAVSEATRICWARGVKATVESKNKNSGAICDPVIIDTIARACERLGVNAVPMMSGAGHDAMRLALICPVGMIFIRSRNGISHTPEEYSSPEDCRDGVNVLYQTLMELAK